MVENHCYWSLSVNIIIQCMLTVRRKHFYLFLSVKYPDWFLEPSVPNIMNYKS